MILTLRQKAIVLNLRKWDAIALCLVGLGIFFRLFHFFHNRSLWMDEMFLTVSLIKMNFIELATVPLEYQQKAPIGFLWLMKLSVTLFGTGDKAMRLFPLLCGIVSLPLFIAVSKKFLKPLGAAVAIGILALSPHLIYHSVEAKQYSTEVLCTILALYLYIRFYKRPDYRSLFLWGFLGGLILWFSFSSIFVLVGMAGGLSLFHLIKKDWRSFFLYLIPFFLWLISFIVNYFLFTMKHTDSEWLILWFKHREGFMPDTLKGSVVWLSKKIFTLLNFPLGLSWFPLPDQYHRIAPLLILVRMSFIHLSLLVLGLIYLYKKNLKTFLILVFPWLLHLFAAALLVYPFYERLTVYLAPLLIVLIAFGCEKVLSVFLSKTSFLNPANTKNIQETKNREYSTQVAQK